MVYCLNTSQDPYDLLVINSTKKLSFHFTKKKQRYRSLLQPH